MNYNAMQKVCGLREGDKVKFLREWERGELGYSIGVCESNQDIGKTGTIKEILDNKIRVCIPGSYTWSLPFFVLRKVEKEPVYINEDEEYKVEFLDNGDIKVGCQEISFEKIKEIYEEAKKVREQ